jgi:hypothetical protein
MWKAASILICSKRKQNNFVVVSYNNNKMRLKWSESGVTVSPELKLLQYNILPLVLDEQNIYTGEKNGYTGITPLETTSHNHTFRQFLQIGRQLPIRAPNRPPLDPNLCTIIPSSGTLLVQLLARSGCSTRTSDSTGDMFADPRNHVYRLALRHTSSGLHQGTVQYFWDKHSSDLQALDLWMAGCMLSVFAALGEFVIVKVLDGKYQAMKKKQCEEAMVKNITGGGGDSKTILL